MSYTFDEHFETVKSYSEWHKGHLEAIPDEKLTLFECIIDKVLNFETDSQPHFFSDDWRHYRNFYGFLLDSCLDAINFNPRVAVIEKNSLNEICDWYEEHFSLARSFASPAPVHTMTLLDWVSEEPPCPINRPHELPGTDPDPMMDLAYFTSFDEMGNRLASENKWPLSLIFVKDYRSPAKGDVTILQFYKKFFHEDNCLRRDNRCMHEKNQHFDPAPVGVLEDILKFDFECTCD